jgi:hypothetical protein
MKPMAEVEVLQLSKSPKDQIHTKMNRIYRRKTIRRHHTVRNGGGGEETCSRKGSGAEKELHEGGAGDVYCIATH